VNIFYLDNDPVKCAEMHVDKHCVKMILEYAQLLSTAHRVLDGIPTVCLSKMGRKQTRYLVADDRDSILYSATHINHPSAIWCRANVENYLWLHSLLVACCNEYTYRYGKVHKCQQTGLVDALNVSPTNIPVGEFTKPTPAMPDECKVAGDALKSYHNYYAMNKQHLWSWKGKINSRSRPSWLNEILMQRLHDTNQELGLIY
jgi:hypothetical protein